MGEAFENNCLSGLRNLALALAFIIISFAVTDLRNTKNCTGLLLSFASLSFLWKFMFLLLSFAPPNHQLKNRYEGVINNYPELI
jgi:hypothetical protein